MEYMTVRQFCDLRYGLHGREPTKAQQNTVTQMCRDKKFAEQFKVGRTWFIGIGG